MDLEETGKLGMQLEHVTMEESKIIGTPFLWPVWTLSPLLCDQLVLEEAAA